MISRKQRIQFRDFSTLSAEDRELAERSKVNGNVVNIFRVLMNNPKLARAWSKDPQVKAGCSSKAMTTGRAGPRS